jgi:predicted ATPase/DNA-binding CsgD family transcriptional regulator
MSSLPVQPSPIIGREAEIVTLTEKLLQPEVRLLTLVGPGGVGKTSLAVRVAQEVGSSFSDGVWFVGLALISDPILVIPTIAQAFDLHALPGRSLLAVLKEYLRDKSVLLLLDNFEQVMTAAAILAELLATCPRLKLLVTSRSPLHLRSEQEFPVPPLSLPDLDRRRMPDLEALQRYSAVALFEQRAAAVRPDFTINSRNAEAIVEICARLDGLPLAIELVAARVKMLQPHAILQRLGKSLELLTGGAQDLPARQQTLRDAIEWSYDLLTREEQALFRRLAVFVGGCTLEAAEEICQLDGGQPTTNDRAIVRSLDVLDGIGSLIDKSLMRQVEGDGKDEAHYSMLETIREYALEQLEGRGLAEIIRDRHATYYVKLAEETEPLLTGATQTECLDKLEREHGNFRAALTWCQTSGNGAEMGFRLAGALARIWSLRDYLAEGRDWLQRTLAVPGAIEPTATRTKALYAAAIIADNQGDYAAVRAYCRESLAIKRELRDTLNVASCYILLAKAASNEEDYAAARSLLEEGLGVARPAGDLHGLAHCLNGLGELARLQDDYDAALRHYEECLQLFRRMGNTYGIGFSLHNLAHVYMHMGEFERAVAMLDEGLALYRGLGNRLGIAMCVSALSGVALHKGDGRKAARLLGAAQALLDSIGALLDPADLKAYHGNEGAAREQLGEAEFVAAWAEGNAVTPEQVVEIGAMPVQVGKVSGADRPAGAERVGRDVTGGQATPDVLSAREMDVLRLVGRGLSDADVARELNVSPHTVRAHIRSIYSKIGLGSRSAATRYAAERGIV